MDICSVENCNNFAKRSGMCIKHFAQMQRLGFIIDESAPRNFIDFGEEFSRLYLYRRSGDVSGVVLIDNFNIQKIKHIKWCLDVHGYAVGRVNGKVEKMHRILCGFSEDVDHINQNKLDNRMSNLRKTTKSTNGMNRQKPKTNSTGFKGVCRTGSGFIAYINFNGKRMHIGSYQDVEKAAMAYNEAAIKLHGEFSYLNEIKNV